MAITISQPQINREDSCWTLSTRAPWAGDDDRPAFIFAPSYELRIRHNAVEDIFEFLRYEDGTGVKLLSPGEWSGRIEAIMENEGDDEDEAITWLQVNDFRKANESEIAVRNELRRYWDAFALLFTPAVTF
jgi:hypothetical protein